MTTKISASDKIKRASLAIMGHKKFCLYSGVLACGKTTIDDTINPPTACTDGWNVMYHPDFLDSLNDKQVRFLVLHEAVHKAFRHLDTWRAIFEKDAQRANIAADVFVQLVISDTDAGEGFVEIPPVGVPVLPEFRGMSVGQIYDKLPEMKGGGGSGDMQAMDGHILPEDGEGGDGDEAAKARNAMQAQEIDRAIRQGEQMVKARGGGSDTRDGALGELLTPQVDWKRLLREFVQDTCKGSDEATWNRVSRRFVAQDLYMPGTFTEQMGELVIGFDTSGSCFGTDVMTRFGSELASIIKAVAPSRTRVLYWDTNVVHEQVFDEPGRFEIADLKPAGGGGTDGSCLFDYLREKRIKPQAIVQFTDGYVGDWGRTDVPTLWAITEASITAPFGVSVHIKV